MLPKNLKVALIVALVGFLLSQALISALVLGGTAFAADLLL